jgi:hypothetical protein
VTLTTGGRTVVSTVIPTASAVSTGIGRNKVFASSSSSHGLSSRAKAGIAVGVILGVAVLALLSFFLGQGYSRRRSGKSSKPRDESRSSITETKNSFHAGVAYEDTGSKWPTMGSSGAKGHPHSVATTEVGSPTTSTSAKSVDTAPNPGIYYNSPPDISPLPQIGKDETMYAGVPAHMSGSQRWSMKEFEKS